VSGARVLVVEDEPRIIRSIRLTLSAHGYDVVSAPTGEAALEELHRRPPDVILLDLMLPGIGGLEVCRRVRERSPVPIIVLSALGDEQVKVQALDLGADDYVTKPIGAAELLARLRVALRHAAGARNAPVFDADDLHVDFAKRRVTRRGHDIPLTPKEFDVLKCLTANAGRVLTHDFILRAVWGPEYEGEIQYLRNVVLALRRKLEPDPSSPTLIVTEPGVGYRLTGAADS
jgi:two-component system KDP operon response regulator KdpE